MFRLLSGNWQGGMCNSLHQLQQNGILCDLLLNLADSKQVHTHSCVMAAASPYLREVIVAKRTSAHLDQLNSEALEALIAYMYSGELEFTKMLLPDILKAAQMLQMDPLVEELARYQHCFLQSPHRIVSRDGCVRQPDIGSSLYLPEVTTPKRLMYDDEDNDDNVSTSSASSSEDDNSYNNGSDQHNTSVTNTLPDLCLPCEACGKTFKQKGALGMHYKSHIIESTNAKGEIDVVKCKACGTVLKKGMHIVAHLDHCPKREKFRIETARTKEQPFHCPLCSNNFEQRGAFGSHMKTHYVETFNKDHVRLAVMCKLCQRVFSERSDFMEHIESCSGRKDREQVKIQCKFANCKYVFQSRSSMLKHHAVHHGRKTSMIFKSSQTIRKPSTSPLESQGLSNLKNSSGGNSGYNVSFRCSRCRKSFKSQADWIRHKLAKHSFFCAKCGKNFRTRSSYQEHAEKQCSGSSSSLQPVKCKLCHREFPQLLSLQKHMKYCVAQKPETIQATGPPVKCELCKKMLSCQAALVKHKDYCKVIRRQNIRAEKANAKETASNDGSTASKTSCASPDDDMKLKKKVVVNGANTKLLSPALTSAKEPGEKKEQQQRFICGLCGIVITDEARFQQHKKVCTDTYNCEGCGSKFKTQAKYIEHKDKHTECVSIDDIFVEEIHACGACNEKFNTPLKVTMHANKCHSGAENQKAMSLYRKDLRQCQVCREKISKHTTPYYHHMWIAHGVKSNFHSAYYKCDLCHTRYIDPRQFEAHEASHEENKMRHACNVCGLKFRRKQLLDRHISEKHADKLKQD